jgi:endo-1,4-beta-D-glucanase Y
MILSANAGGNGRYRVKFESNAGQSVSEGIAYGMILTSLFDDQTEFDGLWLFAKDHFNENGVMHWKIGSPGELLGEGGATDAEVDMAIALINACVKLTHAAWPNSQQGIDYCADAHTLIENIYKHEVDKPGSEPYSGQDDNLGNELLPGDGWTTVEEYPDGIVNLSYFAPGFFRVFGAFTGEPQKWQQVIERNYDIADLAQAKPGNCSKLISNWNTYEGDPQVVSWQGDSSRYWGWDAARFAWRIAVDATWYNDARALETTNELASFFASVGMADMGVEYSMDGQRHQSWNHMFFDANAASSIFAATQLTPVTCGDAKGTLKSNAQQAYDVVNQRGNGGGYYGGYWRLISMMLMTGNFPNLYAMANNGAPLTVRMTAPQPDAVFNDGSNIQLAATTNQNNDINQVSF